jgi:hypothetical protein
MNAPVTTPFSGGSFRDPAPPSPAAFSAGASAPPTPTRPGKPPRGKSGTEQVASTGDSAAEISPLPKPPASAASTPTAAGGVSTENPARSFKSVWLNLRSYVRRLQLQNGLNAVDEVQMYYQHFDLYLRTEHTLQALLVLMPQSKGGLLPIAIGLFHKSPLVRHYALLVLQRIQQYASTRCAYTALDGYFHTAYDRQLEKEASGSLQVEIVEFNRSSKEPRPNTQEGEEVSSTGESAESEGFDPAGALTSLVQNTFALMGGEETYDVAFSETIDELDLLR